MSDSLTPFLSAQRVLLQLERAGVPAADPPIRIDDVVQAVVRTSNVDHVQFLFVDTDNRAVLSSYSRYRASRMGATENRVEIALSLSLDQKTKRFLACKELCHVLLSTSQLSLISNTNEAINFIAGLVDQSAIKPFSAALQAEHFAEICALEILCPFSLREPFYEQYKQNKAGSDGILIVSDLFKIPAKYIETAFNDAYHANAKQTLHTEQSSRLRIDPTSPTLSSDLQIMFQRNVNKAIAENEQLARSARRADAQS